MRTGNPTHSECVQLSDTAFQDQLLRPRALVVEGNAKAQNCSMLISTGINSAVPRCSQQRR